MEFEPEQQGTKIKFENCMLNNFNIVLIKQSLIN